ncbi:SURF1 family protein [Phycicoccus sp. M110.8]|uniref:SURF1 family protein n=1 Tax=Phycicoccus sp. M110.8 TaxID=3075433 RepID=UPI0028FDAFE2|nr:SURF1 family protein [Phycicoccus sp. M110.8]MDU0312919.1 SURF1 family protein [Phycicoccus sp. M110.8]
MLRTALKPRWLGLFAVVLVVVAGCIQLGLWQLHVAQDKGLADALRKAHEARPALLDTVIRPHQPFPNPQSGRSVTAIGTYAADGQFLVGPRRLQGRTGYWVVTPLDVTESNARIAVVRGFVTDTTRPVEPPTGTVSVDGSLAPGESPSDPPPGLPAWPQQARGSVDLAVLVNEWPGELYNAFVFAQTERTATGSGIPTPAGVQRVPPPEVEGGLKWRNAAYAVQWWVFAAFAVFMWSRMVREDARRDDD